MLIKICVPYNLVKNKGLMFMCAEKHTKDTQKKKEFAACTLAALLFSLIVPIIFWSYVFEFIVGFKSLSWKILLILY